MTITDAEALEICEATTPLGFTPLGDRVVIRADIEDHAPQQTESGIVLASSMAAAVEGADTEDSWFVGTIVAVGPLVTHFDCRKFVLRKLTELILHGIPVSEDYTCDWVAADKLKALQHDLEQLPTDCPDPLSVGDRVTFSWASGQQLTIDGTRYLIMRARDVLAVLDKD